MSSEAETKKRVAEDHPTEAPTGKKISNGTADSEEVHSLAAPWVHLKKYSHAPFAESEVSYVECPDLYSGTRPTVFLAGGISNCPNWQVLMKDLVSSMCPGLIPSNPRRKNFDVTASNMHEEQIKWEFDALRAAAVIIFWFPKDTLCPITLYELGTWSVLHRTHGCDIIVGTDPEYGRAADVKTQLSLITGRDFPVYHTLEDLAKALQTWWHDHKE